MVEPKQQTGDVPAWLAVFVVVICLAGGSAVVWWFWSGARPQAIVVEVAPVEEEPQRPRGARRQARPAREGAPSPAPAPRVRETVMRTPPEAPDGIRQLRDNVWRVKSGSATMHITTRESQETRYRFGYAADDLQTEEQRELDTIRWRLQRDAAMAEAVGLSSEQREQLQRVPPIAMQLSDEDRQQLIQLWQEYEQAPEGRRRQPERALREALAEVGQRSRPATDESIQQRAERIRTLLTPELIERFRTTGQ